MFRKLKRRFAYRHIKKFLTEFLPNIGLGYVETFVCEDFRLGQYSVCTTKEKYKLTFWELINGAKEFTLWLNYNGGEGEFITFSIIGFFSFSIIPETHTLDVEGNRQETFLISGVAKFYPKINEGTNVNYTVIEYREPILPSTVLSLKKLKEETYSYIF